MTKKTKLPNKKESRREQIIKAAEDVFSRKDFQSATISDVAKQAGVSDATIYEYFSSKEELLFSIPEANIKNSKNILDEHLEYVRGMENKLRSVIYHLLKYYQDNAEFAAISLMILKTNRKFMETEIYSYLRDYYSIIISIIRQGMETGEFKKDINPHFVRSMILGTIEFVVIRWLMYGSPDDKTKPIDNVDPLFDLIMGGIRREAGLEGLRFRLQLEPGNEKPPA